MSSMLVCSTRARLTRHCWRRCPAQIRVICMAAAQAPGKPKVLIITGPTAVGKTAASLALAERLGGEIISADSVQVYKGLDVGSDKIPLAERRGIAHHLLDVLEPEADFSAGDFYLRARQATEDVLQRGKTPIVVGGTGFYLRWFILGKPSTPAASPQSEAAAQARLEEAWAAARQELGRELSEEERWGRGVDVVEQLGDAESAARLRGEPNNYYRLTRVVDILLQSGGKTLAELNLDEARPLDYDFRCFFLHRPRAELYSRIDRRVEQIVRGGLLQEAQLLLDRGLAPNTNSATRGIGYRQALEFLSAAHTAAAEAAGPATAREGGAVEAAAVESLTEQRVIQLVRDIQSASRKLCHRQMCWFRDDHLFKWVDATRREGEVVSEVLGSWEQPTHQGGCGDSGRLTREEEKAMRQYKPKLELYAKPGLPAVRETLDEARQLVLARRALGQHAAAPGGPSGVPAAGAGPQLEQREGGGQVLEQPEEVAQLQGGANGSSGAAAAAAAAAEAADDALEFGGQTWQAGHINAAEQQLKRQRHD